MSVYINHELFNNENYNIYNLEFYTKGDLKGYAQGMIEFINGKTHEFLYRLYDPENGNSKTLVTLDYGYENPIIDDLWSEIEEDITKVLSKLRIIGNEENLEFWSLCKDAFLS